MGYPGSGVALDCIVSWSLPPFLLCDYILVAIPRGAMGLSVVWNCGIC